MASERAATGWRDAEPIRRDAARAGRDALRWGNRTWQKDLLPRLNKLWNKRTVALGAAGAAVPVAKELIDDAAVRMGIRARREDAPLGSVLRRPAARCDRRPDRRHPHRPEGWA